MNPEQPLTRHIPILVGPIVDALIHPFLQLPLDAEPHWLVDCTLGGGGHCEAFLTALASNPKLSRHRVLAFDRDRAAIQRAQQRFATELAQGRLELHWGRLSEASAVLKGRPVLGLMADLGFSSDQLEDPSRGISFLAEGPLDMRLDSSQGKSCRDILREISENELERVLREYGEERFSRRIAAAMIARRMQGQIPTTTSELVDVIVRSVPRSARHGRIHVATRTFQALRILVNEELSELDTLLDDVISEVKPGGRVAILSFHSLEDRRVKNRVKGSEDFFSLTKKPIQADEEEIRRNPRARSAKLRIFEREQPL